MLILTLCRKCVTLDAGEWYAPPLHPAGSQVSQSWRICSITFTRLSTAVTTARRATVSLLSPFFFLRLVSFLLSQISLK